MPELARLADEVRTTGSPRVLRRGDEDVALLVPIHNRSRRRRSREPSADDVAAFEAAAGGWKGLVDTEQLLRDVYESRRRSSRPPVEL